MNIILNGAKGRMGRIVDAAAAAGGHSVVARVDFGYAGGEGLRRPPPPARGSAPVRTGPDIAQCLIENRENSYFSGTST